MQAKQSKEIETLKRNIGTSKNNERKVQTKIKQIQSEIEQAKKKTNIKEISNRLHSKGQGSSAGTSSKAPSVTSSIGKQPSQTSAKSAGNVNTNIVRENLLKKTQNANAVFPRNNQLLRTSPNIKLNHTSSDSPDQPRKSN